MGRGTFLYFYLFFSSAELFPQNLSLKIAYPREGARIPAVSRSFVFGSVSPATASVWINGSSVSIYKTGSYLAMIPFQPGEFKIKAEAKAGKKIVETFRTVYVSSPIAALPSEPLQISTEGMRPAYNLLMGEGDIIDLRFQGSPNCAAEYRIKNMDENSDWTEMQETDVTGAGIYSASYIIGSDDEADKGIIEYRLKNEFGKKVRATAAGELKILDKNKPLIYETTSEETVLKAGPNIGAEQMGYEIFLPKGVKLKANGQSGTEVRIKLSESLHLWTDEKNLIKMSDAGLHPRVVLGSIRSQESARTASLNLSMKERVPYKISLSEDLKTVYLTIFYAVSNLDRVPYDMKQNKRIQSIHCSQSGTETVEIKIALKEKIWGYDMRYEGNNLVCELVFAPERKKNKGPMEGLVVAVDPGHSPKEADGAIGPQGITESEVNYKIALCLKEKLEKAGSKVIFTRQENEPISLTDRGKRAVKSKADIFISVHANALADGANPFERRGFSIFYFQPHSLELAKAVHNFYQKMAGITDDGLYYGNLAVCRITQMPSILTESAYLIHPEEEELLLSRQFQCLVSEAIVKGVIQFLQFYE